MVALVKWGDDFKTGWAFMDDDHHRIVDLVNDLQSAARGGAGHDAVPRVVGELISVMRGHFDKEETAMRKSHYPLFSDHKMQHDLMRMKLDELVRNLAASINITAGDLIEFMTNWLTQHTLRHDRDLARHLSKKIGVGH